MRSERGNYKVCGWRESLFFQVLALTDSRTPLFPRPCQPGVSFQRWPEVRGELLVESKEMLHSLPNGCKKGPNMDEKNEAYSKEGTSHSMSVMALLCWEDTEADNEMRE